jgi:hypothetical protein
MSQLSEKKKLSGAVFYLKPEAPLFARERKVVQFITLHLRKDFGKRISLNLVDFDNIINRLNSYKKQKNYPCEIGLGVNDQ